MDKRFLTQEQRKQYDEIGFVLIKNIFEKIELSEFEQAFLQLVESFSARRFSSLHDPELLTFFQNNLDIESKIYSEIRKVPAIQSIASHPYIVRILNELEDGKPFGLLEKMILRIDLPNATEEVAHWHQDYFYVKGNSEIITLWMPLEDVNHENGCLLVQPRSHKMGAIAHPQQIGKRNIPAEDVVAKIEPVEVEMQFGDLLLFHAYLLHSGQINVSNGIRYSFQFRYTPIGQPTDPGMGQVIPLMQAGASDDN